MEIETLLGQGLAIPLILAGASGLAMTPWVIYSKAPPGPFLKGAGFSFLALMAGVFSVSGWQDENSIDVVTLIARVIFADKVLGFLI